VDAQWYVPSSPSAPISPPLYIPMLDRSDKARGTRLMIGAIGGFDKIKRRLMMSLRDEYFLNVQGNTDSEWAFAVFLNELANLGCNPSDQKPGGFGHAVLRQAMTNTISNINKWCKEVGEQEPSLLNFALTDGEAVIATRYVSSPTEEPASLFFRYECRYG
jgi:glutamine amidotransferase